MGWIEKIIAKPTRNRFAKLYKENSKNKVKHIAFIMDGNRRFARKKGIPIFQGHLEGFKVLENVLEWCVKLGIECVTVFAFSIENFKRPSNEVDMLMNLFKEKLIYLCSEKNNLNKHGVGVRVLGDLNLLPRDVKDVAIKCMELTKLNEKSVLNICCPYTSRYEMTEAMNCKNYMNFPVSRGEFESNLFTKSCPPIDILIRTSGETRLSDFMLWQCSENTRICFLSSLWPEFNFYNLYELLLSNENINN